MLVKQRTRKGGRSQIRFDGIGKVVKLGYLMIMADSRSGRFPNMLLRIEVRGSRWKIDDF